MKKGSKNDAADNEMSKHFAEIFSKCLLCGACLEVCPRGLDTPELVINVRSQLPKLSGLSFLKYVSRKALIHPSLLSNLTRFGAAANSMLGGLLPQDSGLRLRLQGFDKKIFKLPASGYIEKLKTGSGTAAAQHNNSTAVGIGFFTGCLANHLQPEIAESTQLMLEKISGSRADVPFAQTCCGMAALAAGRTDEARELARKNIMAFEANDFPILTSCSSCYYQLKSYNELFESEPEWQQRAQRFSDRLLEFSTYFLEEFPVLSGNLILPGTASAKQVFYHDPCHLRFTLKITEEPRKLLRQIPNLELQELPGGARCCGQGGLFQVAHPELAREIQTKLIKEFSSLTARTVITGCSGCLLQWQHGLTGDLGRYKAEHLAVFIARHLR